MPTIPAILADHARSHYPRRFGKPVQGLPTGFAAGESLAVLAEPVLSFVEVLRSDQRKCKKGPGGVIPPGSSHARLYASQGLLFSRIGLGR